MGLYQRPVLITGGAGFIGSHLVRRLLNEGHSVAVLVKETTQRRRIENLSERLTFIRDDLSDLDRLKVSFRELNPQGIFHCAASGIKSGVAASEDELVKTNVTGTMHLARALEEIDYKFLVNCGSYLEYGRKERPFQETDRCDPVEAYAITKLAATLHLQAVAERTGKPVITFRIFSPYGPEMEEGRLVYEVVRRALQNEEIVLTRPETARDFIFVDDIVDLCLEAIAKAPVLKGEIFNVGRGRAVTLKELVNLVLEMTSSKSVVRWGQAKDVTYDRGCQEADMGKTLSVFSWRPTRGLEAGIGKMIEWIKGTFRAN